MSRGDPPQRLEPRSFIGVFCEEEAGKGPSQPSLQALPMTVCIVIVANQLILYKAKEDKRLTSWYL